MKGWKLSIEVLEDLHIGTGTGWGDIDSLQVRDRRGWPVLPASHIKGLLRETAVQWRLTEPEALSRQHIDRFFGRTGSGQGQLQLTSAYLDAEHSTLLWGSTRIDPATGSAQEKSLRFVEYIPAGAMFEMQAALTDADPSDETLLLAIMGRCRQLGSGRNRGQGLIRWSLKNNETQPAPATESLPTPLPARLRLILRNLDPICLARTAHPGNLISTDSYIRGRTLRGALTATCLSMGKADWAQSLLDPMLSWGDALPLPEGTPLTQPSSLEALPIPLSVGTPKAEAPQGDLPWWAFAGKSDAFGARHEIDQIALKEGERPAGKLKRPGEGEFLFRSAQTQPWKRYQPRLLQRLHTRVPSPENGIEQALFSTEEIAEKTLFMADILVTDSHQAETLNTVIQALRAHWLRFGRGGKPVIIERAVWLPMPAHSKASENSFTLLLESDLIVRDALGNCQDRLNAKALAELVGQAPEGVNSTRDFSEGCELFGFNASTGLPRLAQRAIKAGSVIRIEGPDAMKLRQTLASRLALGECPEEGFGRFRLDSLPLPCKPGPATLPEPANLEPSREETLCREAREWCERFGRALNQPSRSQWGEFRGCMQAARSHAEIDAVFERIKAAAQKHGGKAWGDFVSHAQNNPFRNHLAQLPLADAQSLLENFVRWQRALEQQQEAGQ